MKYYDISPLLSEKTGVFPGDRSYSRDVTMTCAQGDPITLSSICTTLHLGAHADAPNHYHQLGHGIDSCDLTRYFGLAQVLHVDVDRGQRVGRRELQGREVLAPRVLLRTGTFPDPESWNSDFAALSAELIEDLGARGVTLVGLDTPSVDPESCKELPSHRALYANDMAVLEGLVLEHVPEGVYLLSALPLKLQGADASPVRAVLFALEAALLAPFK